MSRKKVYIISANYVRDRSEIYSDIEDKFINRTILATQDTEIQGILGTELYDLCLEQMYNYKVSGTSMDSRIQTLVDDYLLNVMLYGVLKDVVLHIYLKITPKTVSKEGGEYSNPVDKDLVLMLQDDYNGKYQNYVQRIYNFLTENDEVYPEWDLTNTSGDAQNYAPLDKGYRSPLAL